MMSLLPGILAQISSLTPMSLKQALASLLICAVAAGGVMMWGRWLLGWWKHQSDAVPCCFQPTGSQRPTIPRAPILLASSWIAVNFVLSHLATTGEKQELPDFPDLQGLAIQLIVFPIFIGAVLIGLWEFFSQKEDLLAYFRLEDWQEDLQTGAEVFLIAMPATLILMMISLLWRQPEDQHLLLRMLQTQTDLPTLLIIVIGVSLCAPLLEELLFRVLLQGGLRQTQQLPQIVSVILVAAVFSLVHGMQDALQLMPLSMCLGYCMAQRQRYWAVVIAHALFNSFMLTSLLLTM